MQTSRVYLILSLCLHFCGSPTCVYCVNQACPYTAQNIHQAYLHCAAISCTASFDLDSKFDNFPRLETELTNAFLDYCSHVPDINSCVLGLLASRQCSQALSEMYLSRANRSNSMCADDGSLGEDIAELLFNVSGSLNLADIDRCRPSSFDFSLCQRFADETRHTDTRSAAAAIDNQETDYLLELSLCVYSSVFVGCPVQTAILTLLYEIDEWLPPRLAANTTEILCTLRHRDIIHS
ncbi:hypothetical protein BsWGS_27862 [Bradybaena similaris]